MMTAMAIPPLPNFAACAAEDPKDTMIAKMREELEKLRDDEQRGKATMNPFAAASVAAEIEEKQHVL